MKPVTTPATPFPNPESKTKARAKPNSEPQKKATLLSLPPDLPLKVADNFLTTTFEVDYINVARTHLVFRNLLKGRKILNAVLEGAKAKVKVRCK